MPVEDVRYIKEEDMKELLLYKRITSITEDKITLEDGLEVAIELTEADCCAGGGGYFKFNDVPLDAVITKVDVGEQRLVEGHHEERLTENTITIYHNQNDVIEANANTDAGNGGYYYSVTSLRIGDVYFPYVEA